jgi:hypothetical protein
MQHNHVIDRVLECHPLAFLMILEGARRYSQEVAASTPADYPPRGLVNPESWIEAAQEIQKALA